MNYAVDRIESDYAVCQNLNTKEMENIPIELLPKYLVDGDIITNINNEYILNNNEKEARLLRIQAKMDKLRTKKGN